MEEGNHSEELEISGVHGNAKEEFAMTINKIMVPHFPVLYFPPLIICFRIF